MTERDKGPEALLRELLLALFGVDDLRRFIRENYGDLVRALPGPGATPDHLFAETVLALGQRHLIDGVLFARLLRERPEQYTPIAEAARAWQVIPHDGSTSADEVTSPLPSATHPRPRSRLAGYRLQELLATGAHGSVWRGEDPTGKTVAMKILRHDLGTDAARIERFFHGPRELAALDDPRIPRIVLPQAEHRGWRFYVMQHVPGMSLAQWLRSERPPGGRVLPMLLALGRTLQRLHGHGLLHGDVTPENILVGDHDTVHLVDFDQLHRADGPSSTTMHITAPSPFMPPEVYKGHHHPGQMDDIFSLALTAASALLHEHVVSFEAFIPGFFEHLPCSPAVKLVLERALHASRSERYREIQAFCDDLATALGEVPARATFGWLHISDLQWGPDTAARWRAVQPGLFADLTEHHAAQGELDAVFCSGDISSGGLAEQFDQAEREVLDEICGFIATLQAGRRPVLLAIPGNHDLTPDEGHAWDAERTVLARWHAFTDKQRLFWADQGRYRAAIAAAFSAYTAWSNRRSAGTQTGLVPGDMATTLHCGELRIGVLALNTAFLALDERDHERRLVLDRRQFDAACGGDGVAWSHRHHLCILMTHHPPSWLAPECRLRELFQGVLAPPQFFMHVFGHQHDPETEACRSYAPGPVFSVQSPSLCGPPTFTRRRFTSCSTEPRPQGYVLGRLRLDGPAGALCIRRPVFHHTPAGCSVQDLDGPEEELLGRAPDETGALRWRLQRAPRLPAEDGPTSRHPPEVRAASPARGTRLTIVSPSPPRPGRRSQQVDRVATHARPGEAAADLKLGPIQGVEILDDLARQQALLAALCELPGVRGAVLVTNDGHVLAECSTGGSLTTTLVRTLVRSAGSAARLLRCSVARRSILCAAEGVQLFIADLGALSAMMIVAPDVGLIAVRQSFAGATGGEADDTPMMQAPGTSQTDPADNISLHLRAFVGLVGNISGVRAVFIASTTGIEHALHRALDAVEVEGLAHLARRVVASAEVADQPIHELRICLDGEALVFVPLSPTQILVCVVDDERVLASLRTALDALLATRLARG